MYTACNMIEQIGIFSKEGFGFELRFFFAFRNIRQCFLEFIFLSFFFYIQNLAKISIKFMLLRRKLLLMGIFFEKVDDDRIGDEILSKRDRSEPEERFQTLRQSFPLRIFHFLKYRNRVRKKRFTRIKFPRKVETVSVLFNLGATRSLANLFSIRGKRGKIAIKFHFILRARARFIVGSNCLPSFQCIGGKKRTDAILKSLEIGLLVQRIGNLFT